MSAPAVPAQPLEVWGRRSSSNVQALMWCIGELGLAYQRHDIGHRHGGTDRPDFAALNPNRTIPVLKDGDGPALWETGAILRYLATRYAPPSFWPSDPIARADVDRWAEWAKLNVAQRFTGPLFWRAGRTTRDRQDPAAIARAQAHFEAALSIAEPRLARHAFLTGAELTLADIQFGHVLWRYYTLDIPHAELPATRAYHDRLTDRPAYRTHVMLPWEELIDNPQA